MKINIKKNTLFYLVSVILSSTFGLIFIPLLTFFLSPNELGTYALINSFIQLALIIPNYSIIMAILRYYPIYLKDNRLNTFYTVIYLVSIGAATALITIWYAVVFLTRNIYDEKTFYLSLIGGVTIFFMFLWRISVTFFQAEQNAKSYAIWNSSEVTFRYVVIFCLLFGGLGIFSPFLGMLIVTVLFFCIVFGKTLLQKKISFTVASDDFKKIFLFSSPLVFSGIGMWILSSSDLFFISFLRNDEEAGLYAAGYALPFQSITVITIAIVSTMEPYIISMWEKDKSINKITNSLKLFSNQFFVVVIPILVGGTILSEEIMILFFNDSFVQSGQIFFPIALGAIFWGVYKIFNIGLYIHNKTKIISLILLLAAITNIILNYLFIPYFGYEAAAITTMVSYLILILLTKFYSNQLLKWRINYKELLKIIFSASLMGIFLLIFNHFYQIYGVLTLIIKLFTSIMIYMFLCIVFNLFRYLPFIGRMKVE